MTGVVVGIALAIGLVAIYALATVSRSRRATANVVHDALVVFVEQSLELGSIVEILGFSGQAAREVLGAERAVALHPADGEWEAVLIGGAPIGKVPAGARGLVGWLKHNPTVITVDEIGGARFGAMRQPLRQLFDFIGCDVLMPLVDRQEVMAVLAIRRNRQVTVERDALALFQEQATTACANARLHVEASHAFSLAREVSLASAFHESLVAAARSGEGRAWKHPRDGADKPLLWMREPDFYEQYEGKTVVFGHTPTTDLPPRDPARREVWRRGPLIGLDTGAGRGGHLSAIELPSGTVYDSR